MLTRQASVNGRLAQTSFVADFGGFLQSVHYQSVSLWGFTPVRLLIDFGLLPGPNLGTRNCGESRLVQATNRAYGSTRNPGADFRNSKRKDRTRNSVGWL